MAGQNTLSQLAEEIGRTNAAMRYFGVNRCRSLQSLTRMTFTAPTLMIPLVGVKRIFVDEQSYRAGQGDCLILPPHTVFDVENIPDAQTTRYLGIALVFDEGVIEQFRTLYGPAISRWTLTPRWVARGTDELFSAIRDWVKHNRSFPADDALTRHRMCEFLLLLARLGAAGNLLFQQQRRLRDRAKHLIALDPSRDWRIGEVAARFAMSESTLSRGLRLDGTCFRDLLEEVRLDRGVELVMATEMPIGQIAHDCGYQSQSRFAERFRLRFSLSPTELRATRRPPQSNLSQTNVIPLGQRHARD
ncbi:MAG: helix-turn-helix domain-containing protein [Pseudorhodobacter sp.]|nr:helix-turn-helix domain-containing protein [Pseudorhodobacter sp.]